MSGRAAVMRGQVIRAKMMAIINSAQASYLSSGIDDLSSILLAFVLDHSREGVFDSRIVRFDKVILDKLYCERGLSCS